MKKLTSYFYDYLKGTAIGIANVIPGVSGGTIAFILGIYDKLTDSIGNLLFDRTNFWERLIFMCHIGLGGLTGIVIFAKIFTFLMQTDAGTQYTYMFFIGLILGTIPFIFNQHSDMKLDVKRGSLFLIALIAVVSIAVLGGGADSVGKTTYEVTKVNELYSTVDISVGYGIWIFVCGILSAGSMVLPGFSGSALLISLGEYSNILYFVDERALLPVTLLSVGTIPGTIVFAKIINICLKKYPAETFYFIFGLLIASIYQLYIQISGILNLSIMPLLISLVCIVAGYFTSLGISKIQKK
jgi:putative membrane protein